MEIIIDRTNEEGYICPQTKKQCDDECCVSAEDCHIKASIGILSEPKQETFEEFLEREGYPEGRTQEIWADGARKGAEWQREQFKTK
jgi:hypothetical protein